MCQTCNNCDGSVTYSVLGSSRRKTEHKTVPFLIWWSSTTHRLQTTYQVSFGWLNFSMILAHTVDSRFILNWSACFLGNQSVLFRQDLFATPTKNPVNVVISNIKYWKYNSLWWRKQKEERFRSQSGTVVKK